VRADYDAVKYVEGPEIRVQIKGRCHADGAMRGQRLGGIKPEQTSCGYPSYPSAGERSASKSMGCGGCSLREHMGSRERAPGRRRQSQEVVDHRI
jgi:hypothetical protein